MKEQKTNKKVKTTFHFCNVGQDVWFKVDQIRNTGNPASKIGNINKAQKEKHIEYNFPFKHMNSKGLNSDINIINTVNKIEANTVEVINLEHKPLLQVLLCTSDIRSVEKIF